VIVLIMAGFSTISVAQKPFIKGTVQDGISYHAIPNANITFPGTRHGCATGLDGEFSLAPDTLPTYMIISHVGYETRRIWLENAPVYGGLNILLKPSVKLLPELEIKSKSEPIPFFKDDQYSVLDYEVDNTLVYLLIYRFRMAKSQLICKADNGDTIATSGTLSFIPTGLFADCLGYLHVLSSDSSYQVYLNKDMLIFPFAADMRKFKSTLSECITSTDDWLFFREESIDHQTVEFYRINRKSKQRQYFASSSDIEKIKMLRNNPIDYQYLLSERIPDGNENLVEWVWVHKILYKPNASVLKLIGDTVVMFNTTDGTLDLYDLDGRFISGLTMPVQHKSGEKWTREIYYDELTHEPYTSFMKNGKLSLYRIGFNSGELFYVLTTSHIFPQKIRVHNNFLFYLYDLPGLGDNKHLFRQKIEIQTSSFPI